MTKEKIDFQMTGERHIPAHAGFDLSLANIDHMLRYALASAFVKDKRVLDISCGIGYGSQYLAMQGAKQVVGVDNDKQSIDFACQFYHHPSINYLNSDAHHLDGLEDESFDMIVSFETIEHLQNPRLFLVELRRLLKPDGQLIISCPNDYRTTVSSWLSDFHIHKFRFKEFRDLFLNVFDEGVFMGQYFTMSSCLVKPITHGGKYFQNESYIKPLPETFFGNQYLEDISAIENADGYLAIYGVDESLVSNQISISQNAFHVIIRDLLQIEVLKNELNQARSQSLQGLEPLETAKQEIAHLNATIAAMRTSKFWRLRELWFSLKKLMGIKTDE